MRDYTYIEGYCFTIWNIYRSKRFDVDRLDINFADKDMPEFVRGLRIVDHLENESYTVHGDDADHLSYSMCFIHNSNKEDRPDQFDEYLTQAISSPVQAQLWDYIASSDRGNRYYIDPLSIQRNGPIVSYLQLTNYPQGNRYG